MFLVMTILAGLLCPAVPARASAAGEVTINKRSDTLYVGETCQLEAYVDGTRADAVWGSSDPDVAEVDSATGLVKGLARGSSVITGMVNGRTVECLISVSDNSSTTTVRYNVLILDQSTSMSGTPMNRAKEAAKKFSSKVLAAGGKNYLAVVGLSDGANLLSTFSNDVSTVNSAINSAKVTGGTNMNEALKMAGELLDGVPGGSGIMKNIILCSDGLPQAGDQLASGRYTSRDYSSYKYANATYRTATALKNKKYFMYALGFFHNSKGKKLEFGKRFMRDIASKDKYYIITNPKDIDDVFNDIANKITSVSVSPKSVTIKVGEKYSLKAYKNGVSQKASWKSSKPSVAKVSSSGQVTGKKAGTAKITATIGSKKATCTVTVKKKAKDKTTIKLNKSSASVYVKKSIKLKATVKGTGKKVTWKSSDSKIATVKNGKVTGVKAGKATITATVNGKSATCKVTVKIKHPDYSQYFMVPKTRSSYGSHKVNEYGVRLEFNPGAKIKKCAVYLEKSGSTYKRTLACTGKNISYAYYVPYLAYNGKVRYDGRHTYRIKYYSLSKDSKGVWSCDGRYSLITANLEDSHGRNLSIQSTGVAGKNMKVFYNLEKMKNWLNK